jgi:predicted amidohydrolase YtcJ
LIDLKGAFVMPGFNDAHAHIAYAGRQKLAVDLDGVASLDEMQSRIQVAAAKAPKGAWLQGGGWDHTKWPGQTLPNRQDIDAVTGDHPAFFQRTDGHIAIANSLALKMLGVGPTTPDPQGGSFDHAGGKAGAPLTGIIRDTAMELLEKQIPAPTMELREASLKLALADLAAHGITSVQDNSDWDDFLALEAIEREGKLTTRVSEWLAFSDPVPLLQQHRAAHSADDRMLHTGMLKGFMDGSLGSRTAALNAPYSDDAKNSGLARYQQAQLNAMTTERMAAGFQIGFHAIGDHAVEMALDAFAAGEAGHPEARMLRPRIEHSQVLDAEDFARYKQLGVIASMQPNHLLTDMNWAEDRLGASRARYSYAWKSFLNAGVPLAFGTDYPVEPITPFRGLYAAVTRQAEAHPGKAYFPEEKLTIGQAISAYTQGSAYAEFAETYKGRLVAGYVADFVVLDRNLLAIPSPEILNTRVLRTVVGGKTVYQQP